MSSNKAIMADDNKRMTFSQSQQTRKSQPSKQIHLQISANNLKEVFSKDEKL